MPYVCPPTGDALHRATLDGRPQDLGCKPRVSLGAGNDLSDGGRHGVRIRQHVGQQGPDGVVGEAPEGVVLAYMANPEEGLCAAYLATVKEMRLREIRAWGRIATLWRRDRTGRAPPRQHAIGTQTR